MREEKGVESVGIKTVARFKNKRERERKSEINFRHHQPAAITLISDMDWMFVCLNMFLISGGTRVQVTLETSVIEKKEAIMQRS